MSRYSYKLHRQKENQLEVQSTYRRSELYKMTTFQLRDICMREKLVKSIVDPLDREELIRLIMRFRGISDTLFVDNYAADGLERVEEFLKSTTIIPNVEIQVQVPSKLIIYNNTELSYFDHYEIKSSLPLSEGNLMLVDDDFNVSSILQLRESKENCYYIAKNKDVPVKNVQKKQYSIIYIERKESELIYDIYSGKSPFIPANLKVLKIPIVEFKLETIKETENPLVIDFGTANTTAGIFDENKLSHIVLVESRDNEQMTETPLIPSVIGIKKILEDEIQYVFGYEALEMINSNYLDEDMPIFYDIKRWVNDASRKEKVITPDGTFTWVSRKELLKTYLEYIIETASQRFKLKFRKIVLLSPVRQKGKFGQLFKELLSDYQVECELNEGAAVLFENIGKLLEQKNYEKNYWYRAMIMDCGGGTTDLTSCKFKIDNSRVSFRIDLECSYENGDTNYGGNNLTYRIMQLLKIRLCEMVLEKNLFLMEETNGFFLNNFRYVDEHGSKAVYETLDFAYEEAEYILPTRFKKYEDRSAVEYFKVKNNYYYLFDMAEKIKKNFFLNENVFRLDAGWSTEMETERNSKNMFLDRWKLSFLKEGHFININSKSKITFYLYEIQALLSADVYGLMKKFMEPAYKKGNLAQYELIKLTGQSCQSGLFVETLKEFIPGRVIQSTRKQKETLDLKLCCLKGALLYYRSKKLGYTEINHFYETGALPYEVMTYTHDNAENILIHCLNRDEKTGTISRFMEGDQLCLYLKNSDGEILRNYLYEYNPEDLVPVTYEEIEKKYGSKIVQEETDNIVNGESKFFVWSSKEEWGFYVLPVIREKDGLYIGKTGFYNFEDDTWELNFFDGLK